MFEYFPDNYGWSLTFMMGSAVGGDLSEMDRMCRGLADASRARDFAAADSEWLTAWIDGAQRARALGDAAAAAGHGHRAAEAWFRAAAYFQLAERQVAVKGPEAQDAYRTSLDCFQAALAEAWPTAELVDVPFEDHALPAVFVPAADPGAPCIIHFDGLDVTKELIFLMNRRELAARKVSMLIVDHPGIGEALRLRSLFLDADTERPAAACLDYLAARGDVPMERTGLIALSAGGYYAARAAAYEPRLAFCGVWGAIWNYHDTWAARFEALDRGEQPPTSVPWQVPVWVLGVQTRAEALAKLEDFTLEEAVGRIEMPLLVLHGENDRQIPVTVAERVYQGAEGSSDRRLVVIRSDQPGAEHCQLDQIDVAIHALHDWVHEVAGRPGGDSVTSALHGADLEPGRRSPAETVTELVRRVTALRNGDSSQVEALASLYSSDAHVSHPFHPFERDVPLLGREALREHFARAAGAEPAKSEVADLVVHQTTDPEVVVAEFRYVGDVAGRRLDTRCVFIVRVVDGRIVESRDHVDHVASARAYGTLSDLISRLDG
ncbi:nuclear transport factor 2 family protein [Jiangella muralis]|uniref:nuclear transport factor 2 family protein n=1 Tax=Jiangella muralis TaxID=702383 RepID=UPI00069FEB19|nr:nuclear transport factor 2 family protein [Jiangella muralis]